MLGRPMRSLIQKRCQPGDESEFNAIDIEFFVVKKGIHPTRRALLLSALGKNTRSAGLEML